MLIQSGTSKLSFGFCHIFDTYFYDQSSFAEVLGESIWVNKCFLIIYYCCCFLLIYSFLGFTFHLPPFLINVNPRYVLLIDLAIFGFIIFTFQSVFFLIHPDIEFLTLFAVTSLFANISASSVSLAKRSLLSSTSLSTLSIYMLDCMSEIGPPCCTIVFESLIILQSITHVYRYLSIRFRMLLSLTTCSI